MLVPRPVLLTPRRRVAAVVAGTLACVLGATGTASAAANAAFGFASPVAGTVADKDGQGTGFAAVQPNTAGNQYLPANLDLAGGALRVTTTPGDAQPGNNQQNALQVSYAPDDEDYRVMATLRGPIGLNQSFQGGGVFVGPGQNDYVKIIVGMNAAGPRIQVAKEVGGVFTQVASIALPAANTAARVDLVLEIDASAKTVAGKYSLNGGPLQNAGAATSFPSVATAQDTAGIMTTSTGAATPATFVYDSFVVEPVSVLAFQPAQVIHNLSAINPGLQGGAQFPTSLTLGPDGRLYVATQYGRIHVLNLNGNNDVTGVQNVIEQIHNTPNQTFSGAPKSQQGRQVTGIMFDPRSSAANPVLYVSHSDPEIFEEADPGDSTVFPASGRVTKLVLNSAGGVVSQQNLVVGLPRSGENHAVNGMSFKDGWIYLGIGGNTNAGGQSKPFGFFPETPLAASVVRINPDAIGGGTIDVTGNSLFSFTGSGSSVTGLQTSVPNFPGQFEMWATGFRNPYDLLWHSNGSLYTAENERNSGFGNGPDASTGPAGTCPNPAVAVTTPPDRLFKVQQGGYHGHPNPSRGECALRNVDGSVPGGGVAPIGDFQLNSATTGLAEYTADTTGPLLKGQILATSYANVPGGNKLQRVKLNAAGTAVLEKADVASAMSAPIDVTVAPNGDILVAEHNRYAVGGAGAPSGRISRIRPVPSSGLGCSPLGPLADSDGDGFTDQDELDNGTSRCNPADRPADFDGDGISDLNDPDADGDGVVDTQDQWQRDKANGTATALPFSLQFNTPQGGGWFGSGFGGIQLSSNGGGPLAGRMSAGGAGGFLSVTATPGTAAGSANNQHNALQQGFDARAPFTTAISVAEPYSVSGPQGQAGMAVFFGPGENDFVRVGLVGNNGSPVIALDREVGGAFTRPATAPLPLPATSVRLYLEGRPASGQVVAYYRIGLSGQVRELGTVSVPASWFGLPGSAGVMTTTTGAATQDIAFILDDFRIDRGDVSSVPGGGPPTGAIVRKPGVVINNGKRYTNRRKVTLRITPVAGATRVRISPRASLRGKGTRTVRLKASGRYAWTLPAAARPLSKRVYVRFLGPGVGAKKYADAIILDRVKPRVLSARLLTVRGRTRLVIRARDNASRVARMQVRIGRSTARQRAFVRSRVLAVPAGRTVQVRVRDGAGNLSRWTPVTRAR
ncbi:MAG: hypothetical protein AB7V62_00760 [Thermoleophilia bacterium]